MIEAIVFAAFALVLSYLGVMAIRAWAQQRQILDIPNQRSSHTRPTPRGGGLAIVAVTLCGFLLLAAIYHRPPLVPSLLAVAGGLLIAVVSWIDDLHSLPGSVRFGAHTVGALLAIAGLGFIRTLTLPYVGELHLGWWGLPLTCLWIVGLTNAYNFMDGIDGIAGGQALVAGLGWALLGWMAGQQVALALGLLLAAGSLGFLGHNWPPARIFMGDVGSAFLGYTFSILPVAVSGLDNRFVFAGALLVWPFIFDTAFTIIRRLLNKENIFAAHRSHLYQRLVISGHTHKQISALYMVLAAIGVVFAALWIRDGMDSSSVSIAITFLCLALWLLTVWQEQHHRGATRAQTR